MTVVDSEYVQRACSDRGLDCYWLKTPLASLFAQRYAHRNFLYCMDRFVRATGKHRKAFNRIDRALWTWQAQVKSWLQGYRRGHDDRNRTVIELACPGWTIEHAAFVPRSALWALIEYDELACAIVPDACQPARASLMADGEHLLKALVKVAQNR